MSRRTLVLAVVLGAAAVAAAAWLAVRSFQSPSRLAAAPAAADAESAAAPDEPLDAGPPPPTAQVETVEGTVRMRRAGAESDAAPGGILEPDDLLTTGADGRAVIRVDEETSVVLEAGTTVTWGTISGSLSSMQLDQGFVTAQTGEAGGRVFRVQALDRTAQVEGSEGAFDVAADREQLAVAAQSGEVAVQSAGETVAVEAGSYTTVRRGERPGRPRQLPGSVVAEIFWPGTPLEEDGGDRLVAERAVVVRGRLGDGVSGVLQVRNERTGATYRVVARPDGSFEAEVVLAEDVENALVVGGRAFGGRPLEEQRAVVLQDSTPPPLTVRIQ